MPTSPFGWFAWIGVRPYPSVSKCGYTWPRLAAPYQEGLCATGHRPPHPFAIGVLQVLSRDVVEYVGSSPEVAAFALRADTAEPSRGEDQLLGFWVSRAHPRWRVERVLRQSG